MNQIGATLVRSGATLAVNSTILCGIVIGQYALVGPGTFVPKDVPDRAPIVGNLGRVTD